MFLPEVLHTSQVSAIVLGAHQQFLLSKITREESLRTTCTDQISQKQRKKHCKSGNALHNTSLSAVHEVSSNSSWLLTHKRKMSREKKGKAEGLSFLYEGELICTAF